MATPPLSTPPLTRRPGPASLAWGLLLLACVLAAAGLGYWRLSAQIEGERGIVPAATTTDIEIDGISVVTTAASGAQARELGWNLAAREAWKKAGGPAKSDAEIQAMVAAVVVEREQIGPHRYIATLDVIFDRAQAGPYIGGGVQTVGPRSAPMLLIPVLYSGGVSQVYEVRGAWQQAWASFRANASPIDYVRPIGSGSDSLLITAGQPSRRSRAWWRNLLDQFGAADVLMAEARIERQWPGGPVRATFTARYGPDNTYLASFTMSAHDEAGVAPMLAQAVARIDQIYAEALAAGTLKPDTTLNITSHVDPALAALIAAGRDALIAPEPTAAPSLAPPPPAPLVEPRTFTVQFASPDGAALDAALSTLRGTPGVVGATTTSLAIGGTSLMRVSYRGELSALADALRAKGWRVTVGTNALSIKR